MENEENKIGWQKYESLIEEQLSSTFLSDLFNKIVLADEEEEDEESYESAYEQEESAAMSNPAKLALNSKIMEDIGMITNFDCWIGHTNFDITPDIKRIWILSKVLSFKNFSRYRFFIGIGKMFDFKSVRNGIEELLLKKGR